MRSRYCAYVRGLEAYLLDTWHSATRPKDSLAFDARLRWLGLEVRRHVATAGNEAEVEFIARSKLGGRAHRLHETSRFVREGDRWYYVDGEIH